MQAQKPTKTHGKRKLSQSQKSTVKPVTTRKTARAIKTKIKMEAKIQFFTYCFIIYNFKGLQPGGVSIPRGPWWWNYPQSVSPSKLL